MKANELVLPGVETDKDSVKTTRRTDGDRIYAISRRLAQRVTDLEEQVRTLRTTLARIDRRDYRAAEIKNKGNGPSGLDLNEKASESTRLDPCLFGGN